MCVCVLSHVQLFATPWTLALQAPLSMRILQARIPEWVAMPSSRGSSQLRDRTQVSHIAGRFFTIWATMEAPFNEITRWNSEERKCLSLSPVNPNGNQPWLFIGKTVAEAETPIFWPPDAKSRLIGKDTDAGKDWWQEENRATEDEMVGWHHQLNEPEFEQTPGDSEGQGSLACSSPRGRKESDMTEQLNISNVMVFRGGAFGRWLGHEGGALMNGISALIKRPQRAPSPLWPCEDTARRWPSVNQESGPRQTPNLLAPRSWTSQPPETMRNTLLLLVNPPQFMVLSQHKWTKTLFLPHPGSPWWAFFRTQLFTKSPTRIDIHAVLPKILLCPHPLPPAVLTS